MDLSKQQYNKFKGTAPEGMVLVPWEFLEELKDFEVWKEFKYSNQEWVLDKCGEIFSTRNQE
jgi:hypothetical protein